MPNQTSLEASRKLAILIDADNASHAVIGSLLAEVAKYGTANVKRIYGNWESQLLDGWKKILLNYSIQPVQQFNYTKEKNATDIAMVIDAMDLLYAGHFDGFCLVSSDSDFTPLAQRIRAAGLIVYGFGEKKTPDAFVNACNKFIFTEVLVAPSERDGRNKKPIRPVTRAPALMKVDADLFNLLRTAAEASSEEDGWSLLSKVGSIIVEQSPQFDVRNYGYDKLGELASATGLFEIDYRYPHGDKFAPTVYMRPKNHNDT